jgi:RND family efflux transporter, MFP subunit
MRKNYIYGLCLLVALWGCHFGEKQHGHENHSHEHESHEHSHEGHDEEIHLTSEQIERSGIKTMTIEPKEFSQIIKVSGQILSATGDERTVIATQSGIVSFHNSALSEGSIVIAGQTLVSVSSGKMVDGDPAMRAKAAFEIAEKEFKRAEDLIKDKLISQKEYNEIKLTYENARIAYRASEGNISAKGTHVNSPINGYVKSKFIDEGEYAEAGQPLFVITQNRKLQLRADVTESYYKHLKSIISANFKMAYSDEVYKLSEMNGKLLSFGRSSGNEKFYLPVYFEFDNTGDIVAGSYAEVFLLGKVRANVISVPTTSLTESQGLYFVYIQEHEDAFRRQEVKIGESNGAEVEVLEGLKGGEKVVKTGAYHIKLASTSSSIPHGHEH